MKREGEETRVHVKRHGLLQKSGNNLLSFCVSELV